MRDRDLKMENIVLQDKRKEQIKIVDFGLSNIYTSDNPLRTHCGSPEYAAPELFVVGKRYGPEVDLWSLGIVLYGMITGRLPFVCRPRDEWSSSEKRRRRLMVQINKGLTSAQEKAMCQTSAECKNLINRLLIPIAHERITIREILDHPWIVASSSRNFHARSERDLNASDRIAIVNEIATAMRTTAVTVEAEIIRRKYGEIGGMYNIKVHKLHQTAAAVAACELAPRLLRSSTCQTEDSSSTSVTIRTTRSNFRNGTSRDSYNADRVAVMRHGQVQDRSVKKSSLHGSTTWNWRCRSGNGNHSSEEQRNSMNRCDVFTVNACLSPQKYRTPQVIKIQDNRISGQQLHRDKTQPKSAMPRIDSKKVGKTTGFSRILEVDRDMIFPTLRTNSRISSESMPASRVSETHKKMLNAPSWRFRVGSARIRRDT